MRLYPAAVSGRLPARLLVASAAALVLLAGCGDESSEPTADDGTSGTSGASDGAGTPTAPTPTPSAPASDLPSCDEVWVAGAVLPEGYAGCFDGTAEVVPDPLSCSSGQKIVTYDPYWAVPGAKVQETSGLDTDPAFATVKNQCQA
jgi:hypothetical protein